MPEPYLVSVGEKDKRIDAVMLPDSIGVVRSLALGFNGITAGSFGLYNGDGTLESVEKGVIGELVR